MIKVVKALEGRKRFVVGVDGESKSDVMKEAKKKLKCSEAHLTVKRITVKAALFIGDDLYQEQSTDEKKVWIACYKAEGSKK